jgi:DNA gyrase subunit A
LAEYKDVMAQIADLLDILAKPERVSTIIGEELAAMRPGVWPDQAGRTPLEPSSTVRKSCPPKT